MNHPNNPHHYTLDIRLKVGFFETHHPTYSVLVFIASLFLGDRHIKSGFFEASNNGA